MDPTRMNDWIHPPPGITPLSLWEAFHDANVVRMTTDALDRTATFHMELPYIGEELGLQEGRLFVLTFRGVQSLRATRRLPWPGEYIHPSHLSREEQEAAVRSFQAKGREESVGVADLERAIEQGPFWVLLAEAIQGEAETTVLLEGSAGPNEDLYRLIIRAESLAIEESGGGARTLEELLQIGEKFWAKQSKG